MIKIMTRLNYRPYCRRFAIIGLAACVAAMAASSSAQTPKRSQSGIFGAGQPGEVAVVRHEAKKLGLKNFEMQSRQVDGRLAIDAFTARLGSGTMQGQGLVDWSRPGDQQHMNITVRGVEVQALLNAFQVKLDAQIVGLSNATINTQWQGVRGTQPRQTMNGTVRIDVGPGQIVGADVLRQVASYTGIAELQQIQFSSAVLEGTIRQGVMSITKANFTGSDVQAVGVGLLDLRTEQVKIRFDGGVSPALLARSTMPHVRALASVAKAAGKGQFIKVPLVIIMSGQVRDPQFDLRWATKSDKNED